jgi:hypothetical protein
MGFDLFEIVIKIEYPNIRIRSKHTDITRINVKNKIAVHS